MHTGRRLCAAGVWHVGGQRGANIAGTVVCWNNINTRRPPLPPFAGGCGGRKNRAKMRLQTGGCCSTSRVCVCEIVVRTDVILRTRDDEADDGDDDDELLKTNIIFNQFPVFGVFELVNGLFIHIFIRFPFIYNTHTHMYCAGGN